MRICVSTWKVIFNWSYFCIWVRLKLYETLWERIAVDNWPASVVEQSSFERLMSVLKHW